MSPEVADALDTDEDIDVEEKLLFDDIEGVDQISDYDAQLFYRHLKGGDVVSFAELENRLSSRAKRLAMRYCGYDEHVADDLVQEAWMRAIEKKDGFDFNKRFSSWFFRITVNIAIDRSRKKLRQPKTFFFGDANGERPQNDPATRDPVTMRINAAEVQHVMAQLPEKYREVLELRDIQGLSTAEIAEHIGRKEATVRWRLSEARSRFRELWEQRLAKVEGTTDSPQSAPHPDDLPRAAQRVHPGHVGDVPGQNHPDRHTQDRFRRRAQPVHSV